MKILRATNARYRNLGMRLADNIKLTELLLFYHMSNSRKCMGVNGEALQLHAVTKRHIFYCKSRENLYQYYKSYENLYQYYKSCENLYQYYKSHENPYQVTCVASERVMKSKVCMIKSFITMVPSYTRKISLVCCRWHSYLCSTLVTIQTATNIYGDNYAVLGVVVLWNCPLIDS